MMQEGPVAQALRTEDSRFVPALIAVLVYLAAITLATLLLVSDLGSRWRDDATSRMSVQLAPGDEAGRAGQLEEALAVIRALPQTARVEVLDSSLLAARLLPWLGGAPLPPALALPPVLEVQLKPGAGAGDAVAQAGERLQQILPGAQITLGDAMLEPALLLMRTIEALTALVLCVLAATLCASVVFATRARLAACDEAVELLHLLGADDVAITNVVAHGALRTALIGGAAGLALAIATLVAFAHLAGSATSAELSLSLPGWVVMALLPPAAAALAVLTARLAARRALAQLP
ncbi:MAG: hypothetical protein JNM48_04365 [Rhodospirillales bacterium]|nr:hypothetical protein [Rhodospirillales bacterium]